MTETQSPLPPPIRALTARVAEEIQASFERAIHLESLTADTLREQRRFMPAVDQYLAREGVSQTDPWWRHAVPALLFRRTRLFAGDAAAVTRVFQSSGTTDPERRSQAAFSDAGLRLMDVAMHENASRMLFPDGRATRILVLAPSPEATPTMIMAYGMARLIDRFGLEGSSFLVGPDGLDSEALVEQLEHACAQSTPVTLIGASFGFVHLLDRFGERGVRLALPQGSRTMHAGGFKGRSREALVGSVDHLVAYGGTEAIQTLRAAVPDGLPTTWHGHRLSIAVVLREAVSGSLTALSEDLAYDFSLFDQQACLAPAALYVETDGGADLHRLASAVARKMEVWARRLPPRKLTVADSAARRTWLDERKLDGAKVICAPEGLPFAVVVDAKAALLPCPGDRLVRIVPLPGIDTLFEHLQPMRRFLQCAAVSGEESRVNQIANRLAELGVTRVTHPGLMGLPTMMWRHDGVGCLSSLVRFCDQELSAPQDLRRARTSAAEHLMKATP